MKLCVLDGEAVSSHRTKDSVEMFVMPHFMFWQGLHDVQLDFFLVEGSLDDGLPPVDPVAFDDVAAQQQRR